MARITGANYTISTCKMARDKYFKNHGRKNLFYAKGDICRHEYIEKYYPIYDEARVPKLRTRVDPRTRTRAQIYADVRTTVYYDKWHYALANVEEYYTDCLIQGNHREFCTIEYGDTKHYIYRSIECYYNNSRISKCASKYPRSRGFAKFTGYSHVVYDIEDVIDNARKTYPGCIVSIGYTVPGNMPEHDMDYKYDVYKFIILNHMIYIHYPSYSVFDYGKNLSMAEIDYRLSRWCGPMNQFIHQICYNISQRHEKLNRRWVGGWIGYRPKYRTHVLIYDVDMVFRNIWNRRRHAIIR